MIFVIYDIIKYDKEDNIYGVVFSVPKLVNMRHNIGDDWICNGIIVEIFNDPGNGNRLFETDEKDHACISSNIAKNIRNQIRRIGKIKKEIPFKENNIAVDVISF